MPHPSPLQGPASTRPPSRNTGQDVELALAELSLSGSAQAAGIRKKVVDMYTCRDDVLWAIAQGSLPEREGTRFELQEALANSMMQVYLDEFLSRQTIDDASLQRQYAQYKKDLGRTEYELRIMTLGGRADAAAVLQEFAVSKDFARLARKHSIDPLASQGGYVGWVAEGSLAAETRQLLTRLQRFQISDPVQAPEGTHLLMIEATRPARPAPFEDVRSRLDEAARTENLAHHLADLRRQRSLQDRGTAR